MYTMTSIWLSCILQHQMLLLVRIRTTVLHSSSIIYVLLACRLLKVKFCRDARRHQKRQHLHKWTKVEATYTHFSVIYFESPQEDESQAAFLTNPFSHRSHKNKEILISTSTESTWGGGEDGEFWVSDGLNVIGLFWRFVDRASQYLTNLMHKMCDDTRGYVYNFDLLMMSTCARNM